MLLASPDPDVFLLFLNSFVPSLLFVCLQSAPAWVVLDMGATVIADAFGLWSAGDTVHDPRHMRLEAATAARTGPWSPVGSFVGAAGTASR